MRFKRFMRMRAKNTVKTDIELKYYCGLKY
jgi:hypothetical protein